MEITSKKISIVGGGASGMIAALELSKTHKVQLFEKGKTLGRKFLVAGKGGFNLSNDLKGEQLIDKYRPENFFTPILNNFDSSATRNLLAELGIKTFIGSSGRIFPEPGIKPIDVLNAIKNKLLERGVQIHYNHEFIAFNEKEIRFKTMNGTLVQSFDTCIFALGGASWPITGSNGKWLEAFQNNNIANLPFEAANCGLEIDYSNTNLSQYFGSPLKNIRVSINNTTVKGEAVISEYGLEGNAIYPIASDVREQLKRTGAANINIDLKPFNTETSLLNKISATTLAKNYAYLFKLNKTQIAFLKGFTDKQSYLNPITFVKALKNLSVPISALRPIEEAISTVGGIDRDELNPDLSLKKMPHIYIIGEMFDWDTITGGFLLQACFSTAIFAAKHIVLKTKN